MSEVNIEYEPKTTTFEDALSVFDLTPSSAIKTLLQNNAYQVNDVSLATGDLDEDAKFAILYAPSVDLDEGTVEKISKWLDNDGKYGRNLIFIPTENNVDTPNIDSLLNEWGMQEIGRASCRERV